MPLVGAHMSIAGGYYKAVEEAHRLSCDVVQLFTKNNSQWRAKAISGEEAELFGRRLKDLGIGHPVSHASYLINLASPVDALREKSIEAMVVELQRADQLGIPYVIVHPGASLTLSEEEGIELVGESLNAIHQRAKKAKAQVTLELTAGQGSCLGCSLSSLAAMIAHVKKSERVRICVDTCHAFAAGVDLRDRRKYLAF